MWRLFLVLAGGGAFAAYDGYQELALARGSTFEPLSVELSDLEAGNIPDNKHLRIGEHWRVFEGAVYEYTQSEHTYGEPGANAKVNYLYYPIVSSSSRTVQGESVHGFSVLVRTTRYKTKGAIPAADMKLGKSIRGMIVNDIQTLDEKERKLLRESFTGVNFERLLLLQQGRRPAPRTTSMAFLGGGAIALLMGLAGMYKDVSENT